MKSRLPLWVICVPGLLLQGAVFGQSSQAPAAPVSAPAQRQPSRNRFLIIADTSEAMKRHAADISQTVAKILNSSASGQLHPGDTLGVWTFNEKLFTGNMALQTWLTEDVDEINLRVGQFLREQKYEKKSSLDAALEGMFAVVKNSDIITIFIISDGSGKMHGTPFDDIINANYQQSAQEMKSSPRPIVTVLQGQGGSIIKFTVNALPWPVVIPELPIPIKGAPNTPVVAASAKPVSPPVAPPVEQPALTMAQTNVPAPKPVVVPVAPPVAPATVTTPIPVPAVAPVSRPAVAPVVATTVAANAARPAPPAMAAPAAPAVPPAVPGPAVKVTPTGVLPDPNARANAAATNAASTNARVASTVGGGTNAPATTNGVTAKANAFLAQATAFGKSLLADKTKLIYIGVGAFALLLLVVVLRRVRRSNTHSRISLISTSINDQSQS